MSLKGFQRSVIRAPQQLRTKFNIGESTKDPVYIDAERRFSELETETKKLHDESKKYFDAINGMLDHQIEFSKAMTEIYKPISGRMSDPDSLKPEGNPEGIRASEEYQIVVKDLQETMAPELEMIETRIIRPADELLDVIKVIRKQAVKREHKRLDYDRYNATLKKIQDKKEKSMKDEKALWKAESDVEQATQDFNYFNDLMKEELPKLFQLEREFIQPLFQSFYYMQLNIFYTLHEKMQNCDIGYFNLQLNIEDAFHEKRADIQQDTEKISIVKFKTSGQRRPPRYGSKPALEGGKSQGLLTAGPSTTSTSPSTSLATTATTTTTTTAETPDTKSGYLGRQQAESTNNNTYEPPPPAYTTSHTTPAPGAAVAPRVQPTALSAIAAAKAKPPPPKPKPMRLSGVPTAEHVTALYDYAAQAEGDLSFRAGDVIEIVSRTQNDQEWWQGKMGGKTGQFPGNYVKVG